MKLLLDHLNDYDFLSLKNEFNGGNGKGENISPAMHWEDAPEGTKSFALTVYDPDAPNWSGFWHWIVFDIPTSVSGLPEGILPQQTSIPMKQARSDYDLYGYCGACPPIGDKPHRYIFSIHALNCETLGFSEEMPNPLLRSKIHAATILSASVITLYQRK